MKLLIDIDDKSLSKIKRWRDKHDSLYCLSEIDQITLSAEALDAVASGKAIDKQNQIDALFNECKQEQRRLLKEIDRIVNVYNDRESAIHLETDGVIDNETLRCQLMGAFDRIAELERINNDLQTRFKESIEGLKQEVVNIIGYDDRYSVEDAIDEVLDRYAKELL